MKTKVVRRYSRVLLSGLAVSVLAACGDQSILPKSADTGSDPKLPQPTHAMIPTVNVAPAVGWPAGGKPVAAPGLTVTAYATGLDHPRWLHVLPNGDVLVAETNAPTRPADNPGIKNWVMGLVKKRAGAGTVSANRITLLHGLNASGAVETKSVFMSGLNSPFGMALIGDQFYVANTDAIVRVPYKNGETKIAAPAQLVAALPAGEINHHWTKSLVASADGSKLYVSVGSNSNVAENGIENEALRASVLEVEPQTGKSRVFASGLRNANGLTWNPQSGALWAVVNERDELGNDLVPDYMTSIKDGGFYGWPYSYYGGNVDTRVSPPRPELVATAIKPDYALGAHTASLGLAFNTGTALPAKYANGAFIGQHGSWNRKPFSGYKVGFVAFADGKPTGEIQDVLTGFLDANGNANGRPVGVAIDKTGALLVADDVGNTIWRVTPNATEPVKQQSRLDQ
jgi:glucose/arabinose dehydrogenase